jgi:hypothetical protein
MKCQLCWKRETAHPSGYCKPCQIWIAWLRKGGGDATNPRS